MRKMKRSLIVKGVNLYYGNNYLKGGEHMQRQNTNKTKLSILSLVNKYNLALRNADYPSQEINTLYNEIYSLIRQYNRDAYINSCLEGTCYKQRAELIDRQQDGHIYVVFEWSVI